MIVPTPELLRDAQQSGYAIGAFNIYNLEGVQAVISAAEASQSPVMLQVHPAALRHGGFVLMALCLEAAERAAVPVAVHLDHSTQVSEIDLAIEAGVSSIMADGSHLPYEENVAFTADIVEFAHAHDIAVEAELGRISGTEDGLTVEEFEARFTDPDLAVAFVEETGVDALAVCIGNVHGPYPAEPHFDFERLATLQQCIRIPLVLHGASGVPDAMVRRSIELGVCKFNVNTEVRRAYMQAVHNTPTSADLLDMMRAAQAAMAAVVADKLHLFGSVGRA